MRRLHVSPGRPVGGALALALAALAFGLAACGGDEEAQPNEPGGAPPPAELDPADFTATVTHPLVPLSSVRETVFEGTEQADGEEVRIRIESRVLDETDVVAGVPVAVVEVKDYEDGELVERTLDYYAQHADGSVWYFGERVDDYEGGEVAGHSGQWLAGEDGAQPGIFMPAEPAVGDEFEQERAPGVAEDRSTVLEVGVDASTPAGDFTACIRTEDFAPLDDVTEHKVYCPGVGLVLEEPPGGRIELVSYR